ncbi:MAG: hypothetical protein ACK559_22570, partial [bacterium]
RAGAREHRQAVAGGGGVDHDEVPGGPAPARGPVQVEDLAELHRVVQAGHGVHEGAEDAVAEDQLEQRSHLDLLDDVVFDGLVGGDAEGVQAGPQLDRGVALAG